MLVLHTSRVLPDRYVHYDVKKPKYQTTSTSFLIYTFVDLLFLLKRNKEANCGHFLLILILLTYKSVRRCLFSSTILFWTNERKWHHQLSLRIHWSVFYLVAVIPSKVITFVMGKNIGVNTMNQISRLNTKNLTYIILIKEFHLRLEWYAAATVVPLRYEKVTFGFDKSKAHAVHITRW